MIRPIGSETFETSVMTSEEVVAFIKAATDAGSDLETAYEDMRMIDNMFSIMRIHLIAHGQIKRTASGHLRKGTSVYDSLNKALDARVNEGR